MLKINKRENRENNNIYYISYIINKLEYDISIVNNLYIAIQNLYCTIEKIDGSRDRYLVIDKNNKLNKKMSNCLINCGLLLLVKLNIQKMMLFLMII